MGYYEVLELLKKTKEEYKQLEKDKDNIDKELITALSKNDISKALNLSGQSVAKSIQKLLKYDQIIKIEGIVNKNKQEVPHYKIK